MSKKLFLSMGVVAALSSGMAFAGQVSIGGQNCFPEKPNAGYLYSYSIASMGVDDTVNNVIVVCPIPNLLPAGTSASATATVKVTTPSPSVYYCRLWKESSIATAAVYPAVAGSSTIVMSGLTFNDSNTLSLECVIPKKTASGKSYISNIKLNW